ncbi:MAG: di-trans,poly-cis-decaprenylcistransferase [Candidatus Chisholmbacteria bacterium]|nr:di-trans,poly-cis-decaprenylcistransferase [Candidatus Chisholmbacteria bacterium]
MTKHLTLPRGIEPPKHVVIIPDGNRRWARERGLPTLVGHKRGFEAAMKLVRAAREMGIHTLTLWAFSTENWNRTKREIQYLMKLYHDMIERNLAEAHKFESRIIHLGRKERIPQSLADKIAKAEEETKHYTRHILNVALDYGGQDDILRAIKKFLEEKSNIKDHISKITDEFLYEEIGRHGKYPIYKFADYLDTSGQPYPYADLMIRTSGELRTSGLLLWQAAYAEFYFEKKHFPDFTPERLRKAIIDFSRRERRFGGN